jgi:carboxymethylenebutenolidase
MNESEVVFPTKYGSMPAFAACPSEPGHFPAVILFMDAPGIREELRNMARRIAKQGYYCLLPDLYYRLGTLRFDVARRNEAMSVLIRGAMTSLTNADVFDDTNAMIAFLDAQEKVSRGPIGAIGHCMSGPFVVTAAARLARMTAVASLYGVNMVTDKPDSPHLLAGKIKGEVYAAFAEIDPAVPSEVVPGFRRALQNAGVASHVEIVPGTHHGFCFAARNDYHPQAAEAAWDDIMAMFERRLREQ